MHASFQLLEYVEVQNTTLFFQDLLLQVCMIYSIRLCKVPCIHVNYTLGRVKKNKSVLLLADLSECTDKHIHIHVDVVHEAV